MVTDPELQLSGKPALGHSSCNEIILICNNTLVVFTIYLTVTPHHYPLPTV